MTEKEPIEVGRERRPMECTLTAEERAQRSDQVHSELEQRAKEQAAQETLEAEAKAKKEEAKAVEQRIAQRDLRIKSLSQAARTGKETRDVELLRMYDPTTGEVSDRRTDTGEVIQLKRGPTTDEWDEIKRKQQQPLKVGDVPITETPSSLAEQTILASARVIAAQHRDDLSDAHESIRDLLDEMGVKEVADESKIWDAYLEEYNLPTKAKKEKRKPRT